MKKIISGILTLSLAIILFANMEQRCQSRNERRVTNSINNQSYVNCQGTPAAKMQPGIFISMSKI